MAEGDRRAGRKIRGQVTALRVSALLCCLCVAVCASAQQVPDWAVGLCGESLKEAVRVHCSPKSVPADGDLWPALIKADANDDRSVLNRFGKDVFRPDDKGAFPEGVTFVSIADKSWWMPDYERLSDYGRDVHVLYPCGSEVVDARKNYMPGVPSGKIFFDNGVLSTGEDTDGQGVWSFPEKSGGEMARSMLYMACVYPSELWVGPGAVFMEAGEYPSLSGYAIGYLLELHESYLPDERERRRSEAVASVQGNVNPFVVWPGLVAHIWGDLKDVPCGGDDEGAGEVEYLRGVYRRADKTIYLVSPFVPDDAVWMIDGRECSGKSIDIADLEAGKHEISFKAEGCHGKVVVLIAD